MINVLSAQQYGKKLKATIQSTGKLGFTEPTAEEFGLDKPCWMKVANDDEVDGLLYLILIREEDPDAFQVCKSGEYYYLPTKYLFDALGYDYQNKKIMFDIVRVSELDSVLGGLVYRMKRRFGKGKVEE